MMVLKIDLFDYLTNPRPYTLLQLTVWRRNFFTIVYYMIIHKKVANYPCLFVKLFYFDLELAKREIILSRDSFLLVWVPP